MSKMVTVIPVLLSIVVSAQYQMASTWCFGYHHMIDFNTMTVSDNVSQMHAGECAVSISDTCGELLFYSNGGEVGMASPFLESGVWNKNHQMMPNGDLEAYGGCNSSRQGLLALPDPGNEDQYYLFKMDCIEHLDSADYGGLNFSKIDMTLDGGLGDVTEKRVSVINEPMREFIVGVQHSNERDYWLITADQDSSFWVLNVSDQGVQLDSIYYFPAYLGNSAKVSPNGEKLFCRLLFDFDNTTGVISNPIDLGISTPISREFSPNSDFLYVGDAHYDTISRANYYQFDMNASNILGSSELLASIDHTAPHSMLLAPNGKIYCYSIDMDTIHAIQSPNLPGQAADFNRNELQLPWQNGFEFSQTFPNYVSSWLVDSSGCALSSSMETIVDMRIYPNPVASEFMIASTTNIKSVRIFSTRGRLMLSETKSKRIDISELVSGVYFVEVTTDEGTRVEKVLKE